MDRSQAPPHPGSVLREYLGQISTDQASRALGVSRTTLTRVLAGSAGISTEMAIRLGRAFGTSPQLWAGLQMTYNLYTAGKRKRPSIKRLIVQAKGGSLHELKGMFPLAPDLKVSIDDMRVKMSNNMAEWDAMPPVGREFGSPDYERLLELDTVAFEVFGSMMRVRNWLDTPHAELGGLTPEDSARTAAGFQRVMHLLRRMPQVKS